MRRRRKTIKKKKRSKKSIDDYINNTIAFKTKFVEANPTIIIKKMNNFYCPSARSL